VGCFWLPVYMSLIIGGGRGQWLGGSSMASAEHEPIMGVWGQIPQRGPGAEPLVRGAKPPFMLKAFWSLDVQLSRQIWPLSKNVLSNFVTRNKVLNHCRVIDAIQKVFMNVQSHNRIQTF